MVLLGSNLGSDYEELFVMDGVLSSLASEIQSRERC